MPRPSPRWWPAVLLLIISGCALVWRWLFGDVITQERVLFSLVVLTLTTLLLLMWLLFFSRIAKKIRIIGFLSMAAAIGAAASLVKVRGVTGDVLPIIEWRWSESVDRYVRPQPVPIPETRVESSTRAKANPAKDRVEKTELEEGSPDTPTKEKKADRAYSQFLGPNRSGIVDGINLETDWEANPPVLVWRRPVGAGWSGYAVAHGLAITQEQNGENEAVIAHRLSTGAEVWRYEYPARYSTSLGGLGPRATPTIVDEKVFTNGATGILTCLNSATGELKWTRNVVQEHQSNNPTWGNSCSPLFLDDNIVVAAGGTDGYALVAYERGTGELIWHGGHDAMGYSSPQLREISGIEQIIIFNRASVAGHDPADGRLLWDFPWSNDQPNVSQPLLVDENLLLVSSGYGIGSKLLRIDRGTDGGFSAEIVWETPRMKAKFTNLVLHEGFVYGLDDGILMCLDPTDGQPLWKRGRFGHGQLILVNNTLILQTEYGEIVLIDPNPDQLTELARLEVMSGKSWNPPALAGNILVVRNEREAACYELPTR